MSLPTIEDLMGMAVSDSFDGAPIPLGDYDGVLTKIEVKPGAKGPYLNIEATVHDDEHKGRKVWDIVSFSEKALGMPGGLAQLLQTTKPEIPSGTTLKELPGLLANLLTSAPVRFEVEHEQKMKDGNLVFDANNEPVMKARIANFLEVSEDFVASLEAEAAGLDDDLPF